LSLLTSDIGWRWRTSRFNPIRNLTPQTLLQSLELFEVGYLRNVALLWEVIEDRDDILHNVAPKRRKSVSRRPWEILTVDESPEAEQHQETLKDFYNSITATDATDENVKGGFRLLVRQMMNAAFHKYAVHETVWKPKGGKLTANLRYVPLYFFENRTGRLRYIGPEGGQADGIPLGENEWMITAGDSAVMKACSICYTFKRLASQDELNFSERFGMPGVHGETDAAKGSKEWEDFVEALYQFANGFVVATNQGTKINLIEAAKSAGQTPFQPLIERMDRMMASLCRGADLSTMSREDSVGASLQEGESNLLLEDDCELISETLQMQLSRYVIQWTYGDGVEPLAYIKLQPPEQEDTELDIKVDEFLLSNGGELDAATTYERYGREVPATMKAGATLKAPKPPAPAAKPGEPIEVPAANDALLQNALADAIGVEKRWLAPIEDLLGEINRKAKDSTLSDADWIAFLEQSSQRLPELLGGMDIKGLADLITAAEGTAAVVGVTNSLRKHATQN
jgi:hypothetical protein